MRPMGLKTIPNWQVSRYSCKVQIKIAVEGSKPADGYLQFCNSLASHLTHCGCLFPPMVDPLASESPTRAGQDSPSRRLRRVGAARLRSEGSAPRGTRSLALPGRNGAGDADQTPLDGLVACMAHLGSAESMRKEVEGEMKGAYRRKLQEVGDCLGYLAWAGLTACAVEMRQMWQEAMQQAPIQGRIFPAQIVLHLHLLMVCNRWYFILM